jgi:UDP-glucuronate 4-epimerase
LVELLEQSLGRKAVRKLVPIQPGDVPATCADVEALSQAVEFAPATPPEVGMRRFVEWYCEYHAVQLAAPSLRQAA